MRADTECVSWRIQPARDRTSAKNNDLPVCGQIHALVDRPQCLLPADDLDAQSLRALIGTCRLLVASRFHAMISGLADGGADHAHRAGRTSTPRCWRRSSSRGTRLDYADLTQPNLRGLFERLERAQDEVRQQIRAHLPAVEEASLRNAHMAVKLLTGQEIQCVPQRRSSHAPVECNS